MLPAPTRPSSVPDAPSPEWVAKNLRHLPKIKAEHRRNERKLKRLARHVERRRIQIEALEAVNETQ